MVRQPAARAVIGRLGTVESATELNLVGDDDAVVVEERDARLVLPRAGDRVAVDRPHSVSPLLVEAERVEVPVVGEDTHLGPFIAYRHILYCPDKRRSDTLLLTKTIQRNNLGVVGMHKNRGKADALAVDFGDQRREIGRASCRERV